jgi:type II secretory pathway pseudopilin PulG
MEQGMECKDRESQIANRKLDNKLSSFGFTSIELIIVIVCLAILTGTAVVSFRLSDQDKALIASDQLIGDIGYTQSLAMGKGEPFRIQFYIDDPQRDYEILNSDGTVLIERKKLPCNGSNNCTRIQSTPFTGAVLIYNSIGEPNGFGPILLKYVSGATETLNLQTVFVYEFTGKAELQ